MPIPGPIRWTQAFAALPLLLVVPSLAAPNSSNAYAIVDGWAKLPAGREMSAVGKVTVDPDGRHIWGTVHCDAGPERFGSERLDSDLDPVIKFDPEGAVVESFGSGLFIWPHGIDVDSSGNVWVTDAVGSGNIPSGNGRGNHVIKFSPCGKVLMTLGTPGVEGRGPDHFTAPSDVAIAGSGDIFIADGHGNTGNNRVVKYDSQGNMDGGEPRPRELRKYIRVRP